jgi:homoserine acetyltransferase
MTPPPASVIELSGEPDLGNIGYPYEAGQAVRDLRVPVLFVVAHGDTAVTVGESRTMFRNAPTRDKRLVVLPSTAGHGWTMLTTGLTSWSAVAGQVADFVRMHGMK